MGKAATAPAGYGLEAFLGGRRILADMLLAQMNSALFALGLLLLIMLGRILLRHQVLAIGAALLVLCLFESLASPLPLWVVLPLEMAIMLIPALLLVRYGLLAAIVNFYVANRLISYPLTEDLSSWTAGPTLFLGGFVVLLALWAARAALAGRPLLRGWLPAS
jgi:hypothetical protein